MSLTISDRSAGDFHVVELAGDIDIESARELRAHIVERISDSSSRVVVDLTDVAFMDSSGLGALVGGWQMTREDGEFRIAGASPVVQRVLSITGMEQVFQLYPTVADATSS
ncbi:STAS domain-containing protein [Aeromicrobium chenweiae]|uniref:Anti-sigma factor antagonist n=1 Tax=Aeromicrobium chenweiae TaxID=2079793 RepID=A0A2S0WHQ6_9ACTN|nr:STAS domain-containing protein [Aeromicrobium chenweiae]AWB90875.1 anti-sigma B factor antagonist [Aeromicrobium chenweiae]TGN32094.1 anti-sigma factor antagonist [Aeromicrobium chenweiae]